MNELPPPDIARRLCWQSGLFAIGGGTFDAGNAVFFTQVVGLSAVQVGTGLSIAAFVTLLLAMPLGHVADRLGHQRVWTLATAAEAICYFCYPLVRDMLGFVAVVVLLAVVSGLATAGRTGYTYAVLDGEGRTRALAYIRTTLNIGMTAGAGIAGVALAVGTRSALLAIPLVTALIMVINAVAIFRMPAVVVESRPSGHLLGALRDLPFVTTMILNNGIGGCHGVIALTILPLWLVQATSAPHSLTAWLFALNSVMAVVLQVPATRGIIDVVSAARSTRRSLTTLAVACCILVLTRASGPHMAVILLVLAMALATLAEVWQSAASWQLMGDLSPTDRRGEYSGAMSVCRQVIQFGAPAAIAWLTMGWHPEGWFVLAGLFLVASLLISPAAAWAQRTRTDSLA